MKVCTKIIQNEAPVIATAPIVEQESIVETDPLEETSIPEHTASGGFQYSPDLTATPVVVTRVKLVVLKNHKKQCVFFDFDCKVDTIEEIAQELVHSRIINAPVGDSEWKDLRHQIKKAVEKRSQVLTASRKQHVLHPLAYKTLSAPAMTAELSTERVQFSTPNLKCRQMFAQKTTISPFLERGVDLPPEDNRQFSSEAQAPENAPENTPEQEECQCVSPGANYKHRLLLTDLGWDCPNFKRPLLSADICSDEGFQDEVALLQHSLMYVNQQGFNFKNFGEWCYTATNAVEWFKKRHGLANDFGVVDAEFWEKLEIEVKKQDLKENIKKQANKAREIRKKNQSVESKAQFIELLNSCHKGLNFGKAPRPE